MPLLDWIFAIVLLISMLIAAWRGFVYEALLLASWIAAFMLAQRLAAPVQNVLPLGNLDAPMRYGVGFVLCFIVLAFAFGWMASLFKRLIRKMGLRPIDRVLGMAFGVLRGLVLLLVVTTLARLTPVHEQTWWQESKCAPWLESTLAHIEPAMPLELRQYINKPLLPGHGLRLPF